MKLSKLIRLSAILFLFFSLPSLSLADQDKQKAAVAAANKFIQLIDAADYDQSWQVTSSFFKNQVSQKQWVQQISKLRPVFGKTINREINTLEYANALPGAPDGEYVVIQYRTTFTKKDNAIETVTPMLDKDGQWRVTGYYIR